MTELIVLTLLSANIPVIGYIDDFVILSPPHLTKIYFRFCKDLMEELGLELSDKPSGCFQGKLGTPTEVLGLDYTVTQDGWTVEIPPDKIAGMSE